LFVAVAHTDTATQVQVTQVDAALGQAVDQHQQAVQGIKEGGQGSQLRADVAVDADHFQVRQLCGAHIQGLGFGDGDAELVFFEAGGDVRVGTGVDIRVDPQRDRSL